MVGGKVQEDSLGRQLASTVREGTATGRGKGGRGNSAVAQQGPAGREKSQRRPRRT